LRWTCVGLHVKYPLFFSDFIETWIFSTEFSINTQIQNLMKFVHWEASCFMTNLLVTFRSFLNTLKRSLGTRRRNKKIPKAPIWRQEEGETLNGLTGGEHQGSTSRGSTVPCDKRDLCEYCLLAVSRRWLLRLKNLIVVRSCHLMANTLLQKKYVPNCNVKKHAFQISLCRYWGLPRERNWTQRNLGCYGQECWKLPPHSLIDWQRHTFQKFYVLEIYWLNSLQIELHQFIKCVSRGTRLFEEWIGHHAWSSGWEAVEETVKTFPGEFGHRYRLSDRQRLKSGVNSGI